MSLDMTPEKKERRPIGWSFLGLILILSGGYLFFDALKSQTDAAPLPTAYQYKIRQGVDTNISYFDNSFYQNGPGKNTAYVTDLTESIEAKFTFDFDASEAADIRYSYFIRAEVRGDYAVKGVDEENPSVWQESYELQKPVVASERVEKFSVSPTASIPFGTYKEAMMNFRTALSLPLNSKIVVSCVLQINGTANGTPFTETKTASISAPLDQQIYTLSTKFDKETSKQVVSDVEQTQQNAGSSLRILAAVALIVVGMGLGIYGLRRQIFKTPYQRELDKIFRYHDGIIIRASRPVDMVGKNVIPVKTFDDMLNLEEELKTPIVACPAGSEATQFVINHGDILYIYTLGRVFVDSESLHDIERALVSEPEAPKRRPSKKKIQ